MSHSVQRSALLSHTAEQMFTLVDDVARYPEFVPGVVATEVHTRTADRLDATLTLRRAGVSFTLRTHNTLHPHSRIDMQLQDGPFRHFRAQWRFRPLGDIGCKVEFEAEFELSRVPFASAAAALLENITGRLVDAFRERADVVYPR